MLSIAVLILCLKIASSQACDGLPPLPMASREFAKSCCNIYPRKMGKHYAGFFESGQLDDPYYYAKSKVISGDVVYIATADVPDFINNYFLRLPADAKIVMVSGSEDIGLPYELFHPRRGYASYSMSALWPQGQRLTMEEFLLDSRLSAWFVQNYDLQGGNASVSASASASVMIRKVIPIPIGLDFHSLSEKARGVSPAAFTSLVCLQRRELQQAVLSSRAFQDKPLRVSVAFKCIFKQGIAFEWKKRTRGELCKSVMRSRAKGYSLYEAPRPALSSDRTPQRWKISGPSAQERYLQSSLRRDKLAFWEHLTTCAFAFAPPGVGMDTHRVWEILHLRSIPIVISSPLDSLYKQYPVIIVTSWDEAFQEGALEEFKSRIIGTFGQNPFSKDVVHRLSAAYWIDRVHSYVNQM